MWCRCVGKSRNPGAWRNSLQGWGASRARQADSHLEGTEDGVTGAAGPSVHACLGEAIGNAHEWGCIRSCDEGGTSTFHHEMMWVCGQQPCMLGHASHPCSRHILLRTHP